MRKTNLLTRSGTCALIISALGLTAPVFTATAASPVIEAVDTIAKRTVESLDEIVPVAPFLKPEIIKLADAPVEATESTGLKPMRLRMRRDYEQKYIEEVDVARKAYVAGDKSAIKEINRLVANDTRKNRFQLTVDDSGLAYLDISTGAGGWPGFPVSNSDWERRPLSVAMKQEMESILSRCGSETSPKYFRSILTGGDADIGKGSYLIECVNGSKSEREALSKVDIAKAFLYSEDLPLSEREGGFNFRMGFAMMEDYVVKKSNATIADDRKECVRMYSYLKANYDFIAENSGGVDRLQSKCSTTDYNWVRKKVGVPEI